MIFYWLNVKNVGNFNLVFEFCLIKLKYKCLIYLYILTLVLDAPCCALLLFKYAGERLIVRQNRLPDDLDFDRENFEETQLSQTNENFGSGQNQNMTQNFNSSPTKITSDEPKIANEEQKQVIIKDIYKGYFFLF